MSKNMNVPKLRFKEFSGDWEKIKIQNLIDNKSIISHLDGNHGALYPKSDEFTKNGIPYVTANDFINGKVNLKKCKCLPIERASKFKKGIAKNGDVLFAHNATVGPVALLETDFDYVVLSTTATYYRCDNQRLLNNYLKVYFNTNDFIEQYSRVMSQSTRNQVPITTQRLFYVQLPSKQEQEKIASFLTSVDTKIEQLTRKEELLQQYKKGVMQKIFSQEIRFKADDGSEFPEWKWKYGNEIFQTITNKNHSSELPILAITQEYGAIPRDMIDYQISVTDKSVATYKVVEIGDFIISLRSFQGGIEYSNYKGICSPAYIILRPHIEVEDRLYKLYMKTDNYIKELNKNIEGIRDGKMISFKQFSEIKLPYPSIEEQTKIANFLSSIDSKIEQVQKQLDSTKEFKKALLQQMFV
ncbi:restriction endonuclease subunit S [Arcobacter ellisii]|uniref:Restriction endonuclease n=1 Tax=Arcobacter ellisii TaxID=913109 RepID=A0A347U8B1_9BACT|nr:restriction endonuclease subunit S [Arcobacter ellisii]AXX95089.1 type I restriction/modification system, specificity subunit [Arcobacter ellisii]RXI30407.1 restriction endonuclease [Arcobacter ellisii]